mgnify:CR=1 FL=1|jgi:uncharacterized MAPEG superfamily protein
MAFTTALILFGLLTVVMLMIEVMTTYATQGFGYGFSSNRSTNTERPPMALRIQRAYQNQVESAVYGVPVLAAAAITGLESGSAETAALLFIIGRGAYALLYYSGISFVRVPAFALGVLSTIYIAYVLLS